MRLNVYTFFQRATGRRLRPETPPTESHGNGVSYAQIRLFWDSSPLMIVIVILASTAHALHMWPILATGWFLGWYVMILAVALLWGRWTQIYRDHGRARPARGMRLWRNRALGVVLVIGTHWAVGALFFLPSLAVEGVTNWFLTAVLLCAGAVALMSAMPFTAMAIYLPAILPVGYVFAANAAPGATSMVGVVMVTLLSLTMSNRNLHTQIRSLILWRRRVRSDQRRNWERDYKYDLVFKQSPLGVVQFDTEGRIVEFNKRFAELLGRSERRLRAARFRDVSTDAALTAALGQSLREGWAPYEGDYERPGLADRITLRAHFKAIQDANNGPCGAIALVEDFTYRKRAERAAYRLAYRDGLTELPNRRAVTETLSERAQEAVNEERLGALLFVDVDNFKRINDSLGHGAGDEILKEIAERLSASVRAIDMVARLGGDEFIILLTDLPACEREARSRCGRVADQLLRVVAEPVKAADVTLSVTASIGIRLFGEEPLTAEEVMRQADAAMYHSKDSGKSTFRVHEAWLEERVSGRMNYEVFLRDALENDFFDLHYQPVVDSSGRIRRAEALLRLTHPAVEDRSPEEFIPVAEESGLIVQIGEWVLHEALKRLAASPLGSPGCIERISINVSPSQFRCNDFVATVERLLQEYPAGRGRIVFELTETLVVFEIEETAKRIASLRGLGVDVEIDDFGTGYSSLGYLEELPVAGIKIDRRFTVGISTASCDAGIVDACLGMARALDLYVVAEGVENESQFEFLRERGCQWFQGFYWYRPIKWDEMECLLVTDESAVDLAKAVVDS